MAAPCRCQQHKVHDRENHEGQCRHHCSSLIGESIDHQWITANGKDASQNCRIEIDPGITLGDGAIVYDEID